VRISSIKGVCHSLAATNGLPKEAVTMYTMQPGFLKFPLIYENVYALEIRRTTGTIDRIDSRIPGEFPESY